nr:hypothetical protein [uncultured Neisseria sp.]
MYNSKQLIKLTACVRYARGWLDMQATACLGVYGWRLDEVLL